MSKMAKLMGSVESSGVYGDCGRRGYTVKAKET